MILNAIRTIKIDTIIFEEAITKAFIKPLLFMITKSEAIPPIKLDKNNRNPEERE